MTGSRPGGQTAARLWESSSTTAATPSPQVEPGSVHERRACCLFFLQICTWFFILSVCLYLQSLLPWEHVSRVELDYTPTGYSSAVSSGCSCSSAPTGRPMCPGPSTLACKSFQSILAAAGGCINDQASAPLPRPTHFHHVTSLCRVDVTEVQIAITIMYLMSAFGGVSLWQAAVMDCYIFNTAKYGHTHTHEHKQMQSRAYRQQHFHAPGVFSPR